MEHQNTGQRLNIFKKPTGYKEIAAENCPLFRLLSNDLTLQIADRH